MSKLSISLTASITMLAVKETLNSLCLLNPEWHKHVYDETLIVILLSSFVISSQLFSWGAIKSSPSWYRHHFKLCCLKRTNIPFFRNSSLTNFPCCFRQTFRLIKPDLSSCRAEVECSSWLSSCLRIIGTDYRLLLCVLTAHWWGMAETHRCSQTHTHTLLSSKETRCRDKGSCKYSQFPPLSAPVHTCRGGHLFIWAAVSLKDIPVCFFPRWG